MYCSLSIFCSALRVFTVCSGPMIGQPNSLFSLVIGLSPEASAMLLAVIIGGYTLIGK
jgi:hypothetical protein